MQELLKDKTLAEIGVAIASQPGRLDKERAVLEGLVSDAKTCVTNSERAQTATASIQQGIRDIEAKRDSARAELDVLIQVAFTEVLHNPTADSEYHAKSLTTSRGKITFFQDVIEFSRRVELPKCRLACLEADLALAEAHANIVTKQAEISAAERMLASKDLLAVEGTISFAREGRTYELLEASWRACGLAASAREAVENEISRQNKRAQVLGPITRHSVGNLF